MKEAELLGSLLPSHPDLVPIIEAIRQKYQLPEISLDDAPIEEIYLGDEIIPLEEFRKDIAEHVRADLSFIPPDRLKQYNALKKLNQNEKMEGLDTLPEDVKTGIDELFHLTKRMFTPTLHAMDNFIDSVVNMLYEYLLTGDAGEIPLDWSRQVITMSNANGETVIHAMANQLADPEEVVQQFRQEYKKAFEGYKRPRITKKIASAGYYLQLARRGKPWKTIVEEYIRNEDINMPWNRHSKRYGEIYRLCEQQLRKRMQRSQKILEIILVDKK